MPDTDDVVQGMDRGCLAQALDKALLRAGRRREVIERPTLDEPLATDPLTLEPAFAKVAPDLFCGSFEPFRRVADAEERLFVVHCVQSIASHEGVPVSRSRWDTRAARQPNSQNFTVPFCAVTSGLAVRRMQQHGIHFKVESTTSFREPMIDHAPKRWVCNGRRSNCEDAHP